MGSAVSTVASGHHPASDEMSGYFAVKKAYESLPLSRQKQEAELAVLAQIFRQEVDGTQEKVTSTDESLKTSEVAILLAMGDEEKLDLNKAVLEAVIQREKSLQASIGVEGGYGKSFGGTKRDTQVENEYANLVRGDQTVDFQDSIVPILRPIMCDNEEVEDMRYVKELYKSTRACLVPWSITCVEPAPSFREDLAKLRSAGKWLRYLGATGCYLWIHSLTKETSALRPPDFIDESAIEEKGEDRNTTGGFPSCHLSELLDLMTTLINFDKKTPLLIDNSHDEKVTAFLSYKAVLADVSILSVGYQKSGTKVSEVMEAVRKKAVAAMKAGSPMVLRLGHLTSEHANFKRKLCARDVFPPEMFQEGGKKMFTPVSKPRCNLMFRPDDQDDGQYLVKSDGFRFCAVTSLQPTEIVDKLGDTIPLGYMQPVYVCS